MRVLLDTCVLAELRKPEGNAGVKAAVARVRDDDLFLSVLTLGEVVKGVGLLPTGRKKRALLEWLAGLEAGFADRILAVDLENCRLWGEASARCQKAGVVVPAVDGLIAATAQRHGLHVMTRNARHFEASGVVVVDPWEDS